MTPWVLVFQSATGMLVTLLVHFGQFAANSSVIVLIVPGVGRVSVPPTIRVLALPPESLMIQSAAALPASLNGAVTVAVTSVQPSHAGGLAVPLSWKCMTITGMCAAFAALSCGCSARGSGAPFRTMM